jgi:hypothetical protein
LSGRADVAELVDAHGSGPCGGNPVEVQVLSSASHVFSGLFYSARVAEVLRREVAVRGVDHGERRSHPTGEGEVKSSHPHLALARRFRLEPLDERAPPASVYRASERPGSSPKSRESCVREPGVLETRGLASRGRLARRDASSKERSAQMSASNTQLIDRPRSRRGVLGLLAAGGGAALATLFGRPEQAHADDGDPLILGTANRASTRTDLITTIDGNFAFGVENRSSTALGAAQFQTANPDGAALDVNGVTLLRSNRRAYGAFVRNESADPEAGGLSVGASGFLPVILAISDASLIEDVGVPKAIAGESTGGGIGVEGRGGLIGVDGTSAGGIGVHGFSEAGDPGLGGLFENHSGGVGLGVIGRVAFGTVGAATLPSGQNSVFVEDDRVTETSNITVTPVTNPGNRFVRWVQRAPGSGFTVHFSSAPPSARPETEFTYFIAEHQEELKGG